MKSIFFLLLLLNSTCFAQHVSVDTLAQRESRKMKPILNLSDTQAVVYMNITKLYFKEINSLNQGVPIENRKIKLKEIRSQFIQQLKALLTSNQLQLLRAYYAEQRNKFKQKQNQRNLNPQFIEGVD